MEIVIQVKGGHTEQFKAYKPCFNELPISVLTKWKIKKDNYLFAKNLKKFRVEITFFLMFKKGFLFNI